MIKVYCKKSFKGTIDIRGHIVEKAIKNNDSIEVTCDAYNGTSIYTPEELNNPVRVQGPYKSQYDGEYYLNVFKWKINKE